MEDLIPFLIVVLISIVGLIGSRKKKNNQANSPSSFKNVNSSDELPDWFKRMIPEEMLNDEEIDWRNEPKPKAEKIPVEVKPEPAPIKPGKYDQFSGFISPLERESLMKLEGGKAVFKKNTIENDNPIIENAINQRARFSIKDFDLRKAVVYSEILNRKYT